MAKILNIPERFDDIKKMLTKALQSAHINFLLGSGASFPAISTAGDIERKIDKLFKEDKVKEANKDMYSFLIGVQTTANLLLKKQDNANNNTSINFYKALIEIIEQILIERKNNLLPKQANIFTTNYDLFIEKAAESFPALKLNDGFNRTPHLDCNFIFTPQCFFNSTFNIGNLYNYKVEIPAINLIKMHGSLSWKRSPDNQDIIYNVVSKEPLPANANEAEIEKYNKDFALVLPQKAKFRETLMDRVYYDLLRIYSNELDKENTLLIAFGFSFLDEHIYDITKRALKNPALKLIIFSYTDTETIKFKDKFAGYNNVDIITNTEGNIDFTKFNSILGSTLPKLMGE